MEIRITQSCAVKGERLKSGAHLTIDKDITQADANALLAMGRAEPAPQKPTRKASRKTEDD